MSQSYCIPAVSKHCAEERISDSRFVVTAGHTPDPEAAREFVSFVQQDHPHATHNCWAFVAGPAGDSRFVGASDDGEPAGTAGAPILQTLLCSGVGELTMVVSRYFGGTKLGTGGLVRAYTSLVQLGLRGLALHHYVPGVLWHVLVPHHCAGVLRHRLGVLGVDIVDEHFGVDLEWRLKCPLAKRDAVWECLYTLTQGLAVVEEE